MGGTEVTPYAPSVEKSVFHDPVLVPNRRGDRCPRSLGGAQTLCLSGMRARGGASHDVPLPPAPRGCRGELLRPSPVGRCSVPAARKVILFQEVLSAKGSCPAQSYAPGHSLQFSGTLQSGYRAMRPLTGCGTSEGPPGFPG